MSLIPNPCLESRAVIALGGPDGGSDPQRERMTEDAYPLTAREPEGSQGFNEL